jgi:hypothetical protein
MGRVEKVGSKVGRSAFKSKLKPTRLEVDLPDEPTDVSSDIRDFSVLVHGEKKIGKTTLFAQEKMALFLEFDPEQRALRIFQRQVPNWPHYEAYVAKIEERAKAGKLKFRTVVVDGVDLMFRSCFEWCCKHMAINHPNEERDFGQSWDFIRKRFQDGVLRLMRVPGIAVRFICHSKWKETERRHGGKFEKLVPNLTGQAEEVLIGLVDVWAAYLYDGKLRVLVVKGDERTGAGHRVDHCFRTADGRAVAEIYMGRSPADAYANLKAAFANEQTYADMEEWRTQRKGGSKGQRKVVMARRK